MAVQIPSGLRPGPGLPPTLGSSPGASGHGVQHRCSGQTDEAHTPDSERNCSLGHQNASCQRAAAPRQLRRLWLCQEAHGWCWSGEGGGRWHCLARTERHSCKARGRVRGCLASESLGRWPGLILPLSILSQSQSLRLQTTGLGGRVPQAHPRVLTKRAWMLRRESGKEK